MFLAKVRVCQQKLWVKKKKGSEAEGEKDRRFPRQMFYVRKFLPKKTTQGKLYKKKPKLQRKTLPKKNPTTQNFTQKKTQG